MNTSPPTAIRLKKSERRLELDWPDGAKVALSAHRLRCDCRCAACVDEFTGKRILDVAKVPIDIAVEHVAPIGNYALKLRFDDGHENGLFTWEHLRELTTAFFQSAPAAT